MKAHGPWKIKKTNQVYADPFVQLRQDAVIRPDGNDGQHVVVSMKAGVCVLAMDEKRQLYLTREFHYAIGRYSIEAVSGGIEPGEDPDTTAARELGEELGLEANRLSYLSTVDPFTTIVVSPTRLYLAQDLKRVARNPEGTEQIESVVMSLEEATEQVLSGAITHGPTCIAILWVSATSDNAGAV